MGQVLKFQSIRTPKQQKISGICGAAPLLDPLLFTIIYFNFQFFFLKFVKSELSKKGTTFLHRILSVHVES
jgi:hypothetical protein